MSGWLFNVLVSLDQFLNVLLGPSLNAILKPVAKFGYPDETLSSVFGKNVESGTCRACRFMCRMLHWFDKNHCQESIESDEGNKF